MIITLCGSARFENLYHFWNKRLTLDGHVVFSLAVFPSSEGSKHWYDEDTKLLLDLIHKRKIDASDAIFVIDEWNEKMYIGTSTQSEIDYALEHEKIIYRASVTCDHPVCPSRLTQRPPCSVCNPGNQRAD